MKATLTTSEAADILFNDKNANWSYAGARALAEYLEEYEESTGEELEFDYVAIRCDFSEWDSLQDWAADYFSGDWREEVGVDIEEIKGILSNADKLEAAGEIADANQMRKHANGILDSAIRDYIEDHGQLIEFESGVIASSF
jgi:hypothetical protein